MKNYQATNGREEYLSLGNDQWVFLPSTSTHPRERKDTPDGTVSTQKPATSNTEKKTSPKKTAK